MATKYDLESLLADTLTVLSNNLNTKISEITTEKGDSLELKTIPTDAYFLQTLNDRMANFDPFVFYGIGEIKPADGAKAGYSGYNVQVEVLVCVRDSGLVDGIAKQMFRYGRALKEIFESNALTGFDKGRVKPIVEGLTPIDIGILNDSFTHKAVGVILRASIG